MKEINTLDELKSIELDIMKKFHTFCVEHKIKYYLCFGTLIGAIRHQGFIPWDDDIDVYMPREDYDKFCNLFPKYQASLNLAIVNHTTKPYLGRVMSKVIDTRTDLKELEYYGDDNIGVFIDLFPLDGIPSNKFHRLCRIFKSKIFSKTIYTKKELKKKGIIEKLFLYFSKPWTELQLLDQMSNFMTKYPYAKSKIVTCYAGIETCCWPKEYFGDGMLQKFEDSEFFIPCNYDAILKDCYGDYIQLPPEDARKPHHITNIYWK